MGIVTAVLAGIVALAGFLIAKDVKVSEFRHAWINDQRNDLAEICALLQDGDTDSAEFNEAFTRFELRENPDKPEWPAVTTAIAELRAHVASGFSAPASRTAGANVIKQLSRRLLKDEWDRVRDGEPFYRRARLFIPILLFAIAGVACWLQSYGRGFIVVGCEVERLIDRTPASCRPVKPTVVRPQPPA